MDQERIKQELAPAVAFLAAQAEKKYNELLDQMHQKVTFYHNGVVKGEYTDVYEAFQAFTDYIRKTFEVSHMNYFDSYVSELLEKRIHLYQMEHHRTGEKDFLVLACADANYVYTPELKPDFTHQSLEELRRERQDYREYAKALRKENQFPDRERNHYATLLHQEILKREATDPSVLQVRYGYDVAGWSEKHGYFRNKVASFDTLEEAKDCFEKLKVKADWGIPTLIIKCTYARSKSSILDDFESEPIRHLGFADSQEIVEKHMMGSRKQWTYLLKGLGGRYTY